MTQSQIRIEKINRRTISLDEIKNKILPILKEAGVKKSSIFGSYVRGEGTKNSDIDILIDFPKSRSLLDFVGLELQLEETLGTKVDLVEYKTIKPRLKPYILGSQIRIL